MSIYFNSNVCDNKSFEDVDRNITSLYSSIYNLVDDINTILAHLEANMNVIDSIAQTNCIRINALEELRPAMDEMSEKLNQKVDLEFFKQKGLRRLLPIIEDDTCSLDVEDINIWFEDFMKEYKV